MRHQLPAVVLLAILGAFAPSSAHAQGAAPGSAAAPPANAEAAAAQATQAVAKTPCGTSVAAPFALPPVGSPPFVWILQPCFNSQGGFSTIENETYMYYIQLRTSQTRQNQFVWYDGATQQTMLADFKRLWATNFLDDLSIEVTDHTFPRSEERRVGKER